MWCTIHIKDGGNGELVVIIWSKFCICWHYFAISWDYASHLFIYFVYFGDQVTDLTLALENQTTFEEYLRNNTNVNTGIDLNVTVLTSRFWPSYKSFDLSLPPEMVTFTCSLESGHVKSFTRLCGILLNYLILLLQVRCVEVFKGFYETRTKHRKLTWIYSLGTCNINGKFESKPIELIVSTYEVILFAKLYYMVLGLESDY